MCLPLWYHRHDRKQAPCTRGRGRHQAPGTRHQACVPWYLVLVHSAYGRRLRSRMGHGWRLVISRRVERWRLVWCWCWWEWRMCLAAGVR